MFHSLFLRVVPLFLALATRPSRPNRCRQIPVASSSSSNRRGRAVLAILDKHAARNPPLQRLESSILHEPYTVCRSAKPPCIVTSPTMISRSLCCPLSCSKGSHCATPWRPGRKSISRPRHAVSSPIFPMRQRSRAKVFPEIKPKTNSFVFDTDNQSGHLPLSRSGEVAVQV